MQNFYISTLLIFCERGVRQCLEHISLRRGMRKRSMASVKECRRPTAGKFCQVAGPRAESVYLISFED